MSSSILKSIAGLCLGLGVAGGLSATPACPTSGTDIICTTVSGTLTLISGPDPLMLAGGTFTAVSALNAVGAPFAQGSATYTNVPLALAVSSSPLGLSCMATLVISTSASKDQFDVTTCTLLSTPSPSTLTTNINFAGGTVPDPIPVAINAGITSGSTATYVCGLGAPLCTSDAPTVLGINGGAIASTCVGCAPVTLTPSTIPTFNSAMGGPPQTSAPVTVGTTGGAEPFALVASTTSGGTWLTVSEPGGSSGGSFTVTATPGSLAAGTYNGTVKVYATATNSPVSLPVKLVIASAAYTLVAAPTSFTFNSVTGVTVPTQSLAVSTSPAMSVPYTAAVSTTPPGGTWLKISATSGTTGGTPLTVTANPAGLAGGVYHGTITLTQTGATNSPVAVPVTFNVTTVTPSPASLTFSFTPGGTTPPPQTLSVTSTSGLPNVTFAASATTMTGGAWLSVTPTSGATNVTSLMVLVTPGTLTAGTYMGDIVITPTGASTPIMVPVTFTISSAPTLSVTPSMLTFAGQTGGTNPASQTLTVSSTGGSLSFTAAASTTPPGGSWLSVTPTSGSTSSPATLTVSINTTGLTSNTYNGAITVSAPLGSPTSINIPVTLTLGTNVLSATPSSLSFAYTVNGTLPASQTFALASTGAGLHFTAAPGAPWLGVTPTSGSTPDTLTVSVNPAGLAPGSYPSMVTITSSSASNSPLNVAVTLTVTAAASLTAAPTSLSFLYNSGGTVPAAQAIAVSLGSLAVPFSAAATTTSGGTWLGVTPTSGTTPGSVSVSIIPAGLLPGTYTGSVNLTSAFTSAATMVPVTLTVVGLTATPSSLSFNFTTGGAPPASQPLTVATSNGSATTFTATPSATIGTWLSLTPTSGSTPATLSVSANPGTLTVGTYNGSITIASPGFTPVTVNVTLTIAAPKTTIILTGPTSFSLSNTSAPLNSVLNIAVSDGSAKAFTVTPPTPAVKWLTVSPLSGTTPGSVTLTVTPAGLTPGTYDTTLTVSVPGTATGSAVVQVMLTVTGANLSVNPSTLTFTYLPGQAIPPAQTLTLTSASGATVALAPTTTNVPWLQVTQAPSAPATVQVTVNPGLLAVGSYQGEIYFTAVGSPTPSLAVAVSLTVSSQGPLPLTATPSNLAFTVPVGGPAPGSQSVALSAGSSALSFSAASSAAWLVVTPTTGVTPATLAVSINPAGLQNSTLTGAITITPTTGAPVTVAVTLTVGTGVALPAITAVQNGASFATEPVAPGLVVSIFGSGLGPQTGVSASAPPAGGSFSTMLGGTQVMFDDNPAPLLYTSSGQVNAVVPFEVMGQATTLVTVTFGGNTSTGTTLGVGTAALGIFTANSTGSGEGAIVNADGTVNSASNPATAGTIVAVYATGGVQTVVSSTDGEVATDQPNNLVQTVTATLGGQPATVQYAGWAPGLIAGVIQVNVMIPNGTSGPQMLQLQIGSNQSQMVTIAVQ